MSFPSRLHGLGVNPRDKVGHKSQMQFAHSGDDNANQLSFNSDQKEQGMFEDIGYNTTCIPPLVSHTESPGKIVIWGSEQQCVERGFRDCQEIHTFLGSRSQEDNEDEDDGGSVGDGKDEGPMSISSSSTASSTSIGARRDDNESNRGQSRIQRGRAMTCHSSEELDTSVTGQLETTDTRQGRERYRGSLKESKSETNVFVSSLSAVTLSGSLSSALDGSRKAFVSQSMYKTNQYSNVNSTTSVQTRLRAAPADAVQNSPLMHPQETQEYPHYSSQDWTQEEGCHYRNGQSSKDGLGHRRKAGFEERVLPRRQQLVRPLCQSEMGRARSLPESNNQPTGIAQPTTVTHDQASHGNGSTRKFTKSSLREPSDFSHLYNTSGVAQFRQPNLASPRETQQVERQPAAPAECSCSPSKPSTLEKRAQTQLTYRRNCSSPNRSGMDSRSSTPPQSPLRTPQDSPRRQPAMYLISRNVSGAARHIPTGCNAANPTSAQGYGNSCLRAPIKTNISTSGIPKAPLNNQQSSPVSNHSSPKESTPSPKLKPKGVRPKIITSVRKNPQFKPQAAEGPYQVSSLPSRLSTYSQNKTASALKDSRKEVCKTQAETSGAPALSASNLLYDKYRQEMQTSSFPSGMLSRNIRAPGHTHGVPPAHTPSHTAPPKLGSKGDNFYEEPSEASRYIGLKNASCEDTQQSRQTGGSGSLVRTGRGLRLGLGAVTRNATGSTNGKAASQKSMVVFSQPVQPVSPAPSQKSYEQKDDQVGTQHPAAAAPATSAASQSQSAASRPLHPKNSQSGLRPPSFCSSRLPAGRLAAFGFVRSSSVSSASSAQSAECTQSDPCRTAPRVGVNEEAPLHRVTAQAGPIITEPQRAPQGRSNSLQPPSTPALPRRYLPPQPRSSPGVGRKEFQRSSEITRSLPSSPKRLAVVPPKPQSPVQSSQRPAAVVRGSASTGSPGREPPLKLQQENLQREKEEAQQRERERQAEEKEKREEMVRLQGCCEQQETKLKTLKEELKKTSLGLEAFIITTQHYCQKNKTTEENQEKLILEMKKIQEEMAFNLLRWDRIQQEKSAMEVAFEKELQELQVQQEAELAAVEESIRRCHSAESEHLKAEHRSEMEELRAQQQEQMDEITLIHQAAMQELRDMHNITMATLHEEHARTMRDLRKAHEQQKILLEEDFDKLRLSLQDQVDTLTFQNQSLRDKAKRFEEALRRSTDEQIVDALAPYQHIEEDLKSLKEVVEMKNQQIHQQEKKISDLEKVAQKNVFLEEKVQVLQQQNEDLRARIQLNLALSRQLSEENANLQGSVEKESTEKKRLSRNNEELLWRLQTSPLVSPASSPLHRSFSSSPIPSSPLFSSSPVAGCDSPTHCQGCSQQAHYISPSHRVATNQNLSPGPATPTHRAAVNQNYSPTHRVSPNRCNANACVSPLLR